MSESGSANRLEPGEEFPVQVGSEKIVGRVLSFRGKQQVQRQLDVITDPNPDVRGSQRFAAMEKAFVLCLHSSEGGEKALDRYLERIDDKAVMEFVGKVMKGAAVGDEEAKKSESQPSLDAESSAEPAQELAAKAS